LSIILLTRLLSPFLFKHAYLYLRYTSYDIVQEYDEIIIGQLFGHLHTDEFRVGGIFAETDNNTSKDNDGNGDILSIPSSISTPLLLGASVSPLHGNDPSFRLVMYDAAGGGKKNAHHRLVDYESHAYSLSTRSWSKLYTFSEAYGDIFLRRRGYPRLSFVPLVNPWKMT
jgi:hypothetical protein